MLMDSGGRSLPSFSLQELSNMPGPLQSWHTNNCSRSSRRICLRIPFAGTLSGLESTKWQRTTSSRCGKVFADRITPLASLLSTRAGCRSRFRLPLQLLRLLRLQLPRLLLRLQHPQLLLRLQHLRRSKPLNTERERLAPPTRSAVGRCPSMMTPRTRPLLRTLLPAPPTRTTTRPLLLLPPPPTRTTTLHLGPRETKRFSIRTAKPPRRFWRRGGTAVR